MAARVAAGSCARHNLASTTRDVRKIRDKLDGAIHGAGGCFLDSFLDEIRARVAEKSFWCRDFDLEREDRQQSEKLVACIGAPMACAGVLDDRRFRLHAIDATA